MLRLALLALFALPLTAAAASEPLNPHAFRKVVDRARPCVLPIVSQPRGTAVIVGVGGELLAPEQFVKKDRITVELRGEKREATLVERDRGLGVAILALTPGEYPAATVGSADKLGRGDALVSLYFDKQGAIATATGSFDKRVQDKGTPRIRSDVPGPLGAAVFNAKGELVAVNVGKRMTMVPIDVVRARFAKKADE